MNLSNKDKMALIGNVATRVVKDMFNNDELFTLFDVTLITQKIINDTYGIDFTHRDAKRTVQCIVIDEMPNSYETAHITIKDDIKAKLFKPVHRDASEFVPSTKPVTSIDVKTDKRNRVLLTENVIGQINDVDRNACVHVFVESDMIILANTVEAFKRDTDATTAYFVESDRYRIKMAGTYVKQAFGDIPTSVGITNHGDYISLTKK